MPLEVTAKATAVRNALIAAGILAASVGGYMVGASGAVREVVPDVEPQAVEETRPAVRTALINQATDAGVPEGERFFCRRGVISNHPARVYCAHGTAGWLLGPAVDTALGHDTFAALFNGGRLWIVAGGQ